MDSGDQEKWRDDGACRGASASLFFAPDQPSGNSKPFDTTRGKGICAQCPVMLECFWAGIKAEPREFGIWGHVYLEEERHKFIGMDLDWMSPEALREYIINKTPGGKTKKGNRHAGTTRAAGEDPHGGDSQPDSSDQGDDRLAAGVPAA